jgi:uncharacterized protein with beta-barrel porin domain
MHTFSHGPVTIFHNNSLRSTAEVSVQHDSQGARIDVPQAALIAFVAHLVAGERIAQLEQASPLEVLGLERSTTPRLKAAARAAAAAMATAAELLQAGEPSAVASSLATELDACRAELLRAASQEGRR